jgi:hypothetical protein
VRNIINELVIHSMCVQISFKIIPCPVELALLFVSALLLIAHFKNITEITLCFMILMFCS